MSGISFTVDRASRDVVASEFLLFRCNKLEVVFILINKTKVKKLQETGVEPVASRVWSERDNHYTIPVG